MSQSRQPKLLDLVAANEPNHIFAKPEAIAHD